MPQGKKFVYDSVTEGDIVKFVEQWMTVLGNLARYPATNRAVAQAMQRLFDMLPSVLGKREEIEFAELHNLLLVNGEGLSLEAQNKDSVGAFVFIMLENNLRLLKISRNVTETEFQALLEILSRLPDERTADIASLLRQANAMHIKAEPHVRIDFEDFAGFVSRFAPAGPPEQKLPEEVRPEPPCEETSAEIEAEAGDSENHPKKIDPRHARTEVRMAGTYRVQVVVRVGRMALDNAVVMCTEPELQLKHTKGEQGAALYLPAGENEISIQYENYKVKRVLDVSEDLELVDIDLQSIFEY